MSHKDEGLKTRHRQYWKKIEADSVVLDPGIIAISWEDSTIRLHDGYTIGGRIFPMSPAPSLTVNVLTPLSGNGSVSSPISLNIAALANQVPVLANAPITGTGIIGNPLDIDTVALAAALANAVPVAHDATLVGNGTAGAPLSVNWGLAPAPTIAHNGTLSGAGTPASPLAVVPNSLASLVAVSAISPIIGDGKIATPLTLDVAALLPQLHNNVTVYTDGTTITGSGTTANPLVAVPQTPVVVTSSPIVGNGTLASPIDINIVSAIAEISAAGGVPVVHNTSLTGNGTTASPLAVDWTQQPALNVQHDGTMTGQGTAGNPLSVNWATAPAINVQHDGTMTGSGTAGSPLSVNGLSLASQVPVSVNAGLSGNGTAGSPIAINPGVLGPMLAGLVPITVSAPLTGVGTAASPLGITNASGALRGVVQLATAAEGLQPANDTDATTPAYIAAAIAAMPGEKFLQGLQSYNAATNVMTLLMNDGSTVPVDLTSLVADAVAEVPNKHVAASLASPSGSIAITATGIDAQTFTVETNAGIIGIADAAGRFVATTVEGALAEVSDPATLAEMVQGGTPTQRFVQADELVGLLSTVQDRPIAVRGTVAAAVAGYGEGGSSGGYFIKNSGAGTALFAQNSSVDVGGALVAVRGAGGVGDAAQFYRLGAENGSCVYSLMSSTGAGSAGQFLHSGGSGDSVFVSRSGSGLGHGLQVVNNITNDNYAAFVAFREGPNSGEGAYIWRRNAGNGSAILARRDGSGNGVAISAQNYTSGSGDGVYILRDGGSGDALRVWRDDTTGGVGGSGIDVVNYSTGGTGAQVYSETGHGITAQAQANTKAAGYFSHFSATVGVELAVQNGPLGGAGNWSVYAVGPVFSAGGFTTSDKRVKDEIEPIEGALDKLAKLDAIRHVWRGDTVFAKNAPGQHLGLLAQQVEDVFPEVVTRTVYPCGPKPETGPLTPVPVLLEPIAPVFGKKKGPNDKLSDAEAAELVAYEEKLAEFNVTKAAAAKAEARNTATRDRHAAAMAAYDEQKAIADELGEMLAVDYAKLVPVLIAALNEARKRIEALEGK